MPTSPRSSCRAAERRARGRSARPDEPAATSRRSPSSPTAVPDPVAVAITGGIGAGKSEALAAVRAPRRRHRLERRDRPPAARVRRRGASARSSSGSGRASSATTAGSTAARSPQVVFGDREALACLEGLLHPLVSARVPALARAARRPAGSAARVRDRGAAPLRGRRREPLRQGRRDHRAEEAARGARAASLADDRDERLLPDAEKAKRADYAYVNTGSLDELDAFVAGVMEELLGGRA